MARTFRELREWVVVLSRVADARERHANYKSLNAISLHNSNVSVLSQIEFVSHHIKTRFTPQSQEEEMRITAEPQ